MSSLIKADDDFQNRDNIFKAVGGSMDPAEGVNPWASSNDLGQLRGGSSQPASQLQPVDFERHMTRASLGQPDSDAAVPQVTPPTTPLAADPSVLNEFDPLASDPVEKNAREAWENAEGHPPSPVAKDLDMDPNPASATLVAPQTLTPSQNEDTISDSPSPQPTSAPATSSTFPSLASLARTLTGSPRRSVSPPLPLPPRTSSLRHAYHSSLPAFPFNLAMPTPSIPEKPSEIEAKTTYTSENSGSGSPVPASSDGVIVTGSPKPDGQFDFQRFLDQMKTKGADPIAKYLRSFLSNFSKKTFTVNHQIKIIHDFLDFISEKMRTMDGSPWQTCTQQDFDNAMEAMEKLVMNRLYEFTFQPMLPPSQRTTDDLERDHVLHQRISLIGWLREEHLDVPSGGESGNEIKGFLAFAQQELLKINHYKAPRDKLICILNCCKIIFGLIRHLKLPEGADSFIPILIFVVVKANPEHLLSNVEYINRFRSPSKLQSEAGYYLSSLMGAVSFIETMDHSSLSNITQEEFERNVEVAIEELPVSRSPSPPFATALTNSMMRTPRTPSISGTGTPIPTPPKLRPPPSPLAGEEAARPLSLPMPSTHSDVSPDGSSTGHADSSQLSLAEDTRRFFQRTSNTISKPLAAIGRIFSDVLDESGLSGTQGSKENERKMGWRDLPGPFAPLSVGTGTGTGEEEKQQPPMPPWPYNDQVRHSTQQAPQTPMGDGSYQPPIHTPYKPRIRPAYSNSPNNSYLGSTSGPDFTLTSRGSPFMNQPLTMRPWQSHQESPTLAPQALPPQHLQISPHPSRNPTPTLDLGALQDEIDRAHLAALDAARDTLLQIFPTVEREVAEMVLEANDGDLGRSIEGLLEISGGEAQAR